MVKKTLGCKWSGFWLGYEIRRPRLPFSQETFEIPTKTSGFCIVQISNCWNCSCSHSKSPTIWKLDFLKVPTVFSNQTNFDHANNGLVWNSEGNCSQENSNTKISLVLYSDLYLTLISKNTIKLALRSRILIPERFKIVGIWKLDISRFWMIDKYWLYYWHNLW